MGHVYTKKISLDSVDVFTHRVGLDVGAARTVRADMGAAPRMAVVVANVQPKATCVRIPTVPDKLTTQWIAVSKPDIKVGPTRKMALPKVSASPRRIQMEFGRTGLKTKKIAFESWHRVNTYKWNQIRNMAVTRDAVNAARLPYPLISEYIVALSEKAKSRYTDVQMMGIFDHIPVHYASGMTIDGVIGRLWFHFLDKPRGDKKFMRAVYGQIRSTGELVQVFFPLR